MKNIFKTVLASTLLVPALVACSGGNDKIVAYTNNFGGEMLVNCDKGTVKLVDNSEAPDKFHTPEKFSSEIVRIATKDGNTIGAALGGPIALGMAQGALDTACSADIEARLTEPNENGIRTIAPKQATVVARGDTGNYQDGITISIGDASAYTSVKATNMFADPYVAGEGQRLVVIDITVGNKGKAPATLSGRTFQLQDGEGRRYDPINFNTNLSMWLFETRPNNLSEYASVNPGARETHTLAFRVPSEAGSTLTMVDRNEFVFNILR